MGHLKSIFPAPGGGMSLDKVPEMLETYGQDLIFLIGGGLFKHGPDLVRELPPFQEDGGDDVGKWCPALSCRIPKSAIPKHVSLMAFTRFPWQSRKQQAPVQRRKNIVSLLR